MGRRLIVEGMPEGTALGSWWELRGYPFRVTFKMTTWSPGYPGVVKGQLHLGPPGQSDSLAVGFDEGTFADLIINEKAVRIDLPDSP